MNENKTEAAKTHRIPDAERISDLIEARLHAWRERTVNRSGDQLALDDYMSKSSIEDLIDFVCDVSALAAPLVQPRDTVYPSGSPPSAVQQPVGELLAKLDAFIAWGEADGPTEPAPTITGEDFKAIRAALAQGRSPQEFSA